MLENTRKGNGYDRMEKNISGGQGTSTAVETWTYFRSSSLVNCHGV
jgi:hypothetical protein